MALLTNINGKFSVSDVGAVTFNNAFTFPTADGAANYVLQTNGSGQLAWALNGNGDISGSGTANTVTKFTGAKTIGNGPITFATNNSTFAGDVTIGPKSNASIATSESGGATTKLMSASVGRSGTYSNHEYHLMQNSAVAVTIDVNKNVTFEAPVWIPDYIYHVGDPDTYFGFPTNNEWKVTVGGSTKIFADSNAAYMYYQGGVKLQTTSTGVTVTGAVSATSFLGDLNGTINTATTAVTQPNATDNTKVATTAYVVNKIAELPAGLIFLGTWDADNNTPTLASGGGERSEGTATTLTANKLIDSGATFTTAPAVVAGDRVRVVTPVGPEFALVTSVDSATQLTLAANIVTATGEAYILEVSPFLPEGNYYIVSDNGATNLNGITDWKVGDWVVASSTNVWQKIDNSSVLDGSGTGGSFAGWSGSGTSVTLGNAPVTFSGNNSTFAGDIYVTGTSNSLVVISRDNMFVDGGQFYIGADDSTTNDSFRQRTASGSYFIESRKSGTWTNRLQINTAGTLIGSQGATFAGNVELKSDAGGATKFLRIWNEGTVDATDDALITWQTQASRTYSMGIHRDSGSLTISNQDASVASGELITIDSSGNSTFAGTGTFGNAVRINGTTTTGLVISSNPTSSNGLKLYNNSTTDNAYIYNHFSGNLEIGTNNATVLTMNGTSSTFAGNVKLLGVLELNDVAQSIDFLQSGAINFDSNNDQTGRVLTIGSGRTGDSGGTTNVTFFEDGNSTFAGNIGVGMTPDTSWGTNSHIINLGIANADAGHIGWREQSGADELSVGWNVYHNNTNWYYASNNPANLYTQHNGTHKFQVAGGGTADNVITWTDGLTINSSGNVGIGTTLPESLLHIKGETKAYISFQDTTDGYLGFVGDAANMLTSGTVDNLGLRGEGGIQFGVSDVIKMVLNSSGNVGIGVSDPDSKLDVNAGITSITAGPAMRISKGASPVGLIRYDTLVIEGNDVPTIRLGESDGTVSTIASGDNNLRINTTGDIKFYTSGTATGEGHGGQGGTFAMVIATNQNVGIGTTAPTQSKLVISGGATGAVGGGDAGITMINKFDNPDNSWSILPVITGVSNTGFSIRDNTDSADRLVIDGSGNVGIGTATPGGNLEIKTLSGGSGVNTLRLNTNFSGGNTVDINPFITGANNGGMEIKLAGSQKLVMLPSGNVGIGVTDPKNKLNIFSGTDTMMGFWGGSTYSAMQSVNLANTVLKDMRFDFDEAFFVGNAVGIGNTSPQTTFHVGTTTTVINQFTNQIAASNFFVNGNANGGASFFQCKTAAVNINMMGNNDFACNQFTFYHKPLSTSQNVVGTIATFSSSTQYNTTSDYRLKENIIPLSDSITRLKQLKPSRFNFIEDPERTMDGFLAHEVQNIVPEAVNGEKDAVDENGNEVHQGIDQAKLVPLLVAAIQEQQKAIDDLKSRIKQLEN